MKAAVVESPGNGTLDELAMEMEVSVCIVVCGTLCACMCV